MNGRSIVCLAMGLIAPSVLGQCGPVWLPGLQDVGTSGASREADGAINSAAWWTPDPAHPERAVLAVAGPPYAGGVLVRGGAFWDGDRWAPLSTSSQPPAISKLTATSQGLLASTGTTVVRLVNGVWTRMGPVLTGGTVGAIAEFGPDLYITFIASSRVSASLRRWDGANWSVVGSFDRETSTLLPTAAGLYVTGGFTHVDGLAVNHVARYDGSAWTAGPGLDVASTLREDGGRLYAWTGSLILRWDDDHWTTLGTAPAGYITSMTVHRGEIYLGGLCSQYGTPADGQFVVRLDGGEWRRVGDGVNGLNAPLPTVGFLPTPRGLVVFGAFHSAGGATARNVALWDGEGWRRFGGIDEAVDAMMPYGDRVAVAGAFQNVGPDRASYLALHDGAAWTPVGLGVDGPVHALTTFEGDLIAGGDFTNAGDRPAGGVARWDGHRWRPLGDAGGSVGALTVWGGRLVAGINHRTGGTACSIAAWDGARWTRLGPVLVGGWISTLESYRGRLHAGGYNLSTAEGTTGLARWDDSRWTTVDGRFAGTVYTLKTLGEALYVGGEFGLERNGQFIGNFIVTWNESTGWAGVASNVGPVRAIMPDGDDLIFAGHTTGPSFPPGAFRWSGGATASPISVGGARANALAPFRGGVLMGGDFTTVDGRVSRHLAHLEPAQVPALASGPADAAGVLGGRVELSAAPDFGLAERSGGFSYQWRRNGAAISDGPGGASPGGGTVSGASGVYSDSRAPITLAIDGAAVSDAGAYTLVLTNACGEVAGGPARVVVRETPCPADFNGDGSIDDADYDAFLLAHLRGEASSDFNGDGFLDFFDYDDFIAGYEAGC